MARHFNTGAILRDGYGDAPLYTNEVIVVADSAQPAIPATLCRIRHV